MRRREPGFVDQVDRLVGQVAVGDVAVGEVGRGDQRLVGDGDPVVRLVLVADALQDLDRVGERRLVDLDRLEPALEGGVLLDVLAVLVERGGADRLELAAGEHRLEDAGGVDRPFGGAGTDERVDLVDEQDDVAAGLDLLEDLLQTLLEVASVARAGDEGAEIERVELLVAERVGHVVVDDLLGKAFDDRRLADAGLADQHRIVLGASREDLHHPLELAGAADHGIELALACHLRQVAAELVEDLAVLVVVAALARAADVGAGRTLLAAAAAAGRTAPAAGSTRRTLVAGEQLDDLLAHAAEVGAELDEHLSGDALTLADQPEQDVLGADVVVAELERLTQRELEHLLGAGGERNVARRRRAALPDDLFDLVADGLERNAQRLERLGSDAFALVDESEQDVLGADVAVVEQPSFFLGEDHDPAGPVGEAFEHVSPFVSGEYVHSLYRRVNDLTGRFISRIRVAAELLPVASELVASCSRSPPSSPSPLRFDARPPGRPAGHRGVAAGCRPGLVHAVALAGLGSVFPDWGCLA